MIYRFIGGPLDGQTRERPEPFKGWFVIQAEIDCSATPEPEWPLVVVTHPEFGLVTVPNPRAEPPITEHRYRVEGGDLVYVDSETREPPPPDPHYWER